VAAGECQDIDAACAQWAALGECAKNPAYLHAHCALSCKLCTPKRRVASITSITTAAVPCEDLDAACAQWAQRGECNANPLYLHKQCPSSCNKCATPNGVPCLDEHEECAQWAEAGECAKNAVYLNAHCPKSCKQCVADEPPHVEIKCDDEATQCKMWATQGQCTTSYVQRHCPSSCDLCGKNAAAAQEVASSTQSSAQQAVTGVQGLPNGAPSTPPSPLDDHVVPDKCDFVYIDIGSNAGSALDKFMSPDSYIGKGVRMAHAVSAKGKGVSKWASAAKDITDSLGAPSRKQWCVFAFEGNKFFDLHLQSVQRKYAPLAKSFKVFTQTVVGAIEGPTKLYLDMYNSDSSTPWWGSSIFDDHMSLYVQSPEGAEFRKEHDEQEATQHVVSEVPAVTLDAILQHYAMQGSAVVVRIDAEGAEYPILDAAVARSGLLCEHAMAHLNQKEEGKVVKPIDAGYKRVHVVVAWHRYMETLAHHAIADWAGVLERKMRQCGIEVHSEHGATT